MTLERDFQRRIVRKLRDRYQDALVMKTDPNQIQGIPDILILAHGRYAFLEFKRSGKASHRPNQDYYCTKINQDGGFASFIDPSNETDVLSDLDDYFTKDES